MSNQIQSKQQKVLHPERPPAEQAYHGVRRMKMGEGFVPQAVVMRGLFLLTIIWLTLLASPGVLEAQSFSRSTSSPDRKLEQRAASLARLGRTEEAVDLYLNLLYKNPRNSNLYFRVSNLMPGKEKASTLLQILDDLLQAQPQNTRLAAERGRLLYFLDRKPEAVEDWKRLINQKKGDRFVYTSVTNAMLQAGATDEAIQVLTEGCIKLGDPSAFAFDLARIHAAKHNYAEASREYLVHLDQNPAMLDHISNQLIRLLKNDGAFEIIDNSFHKILRTPGEHQTILLARAKLLLHEKKYQECVETVLASDVSRSMKDVFSIANDLGAEQAWSSAADLYLFISTNSKDKRQTGEALLKLASTYEHRLHAVAPYQSLSGYFQGNQFLDPDIQFISSKDASLERTLKLYDSLQTLLPSTREAFQASFHIAELQLTASGDVDRAIRGFQNIFNNARRSETRLAAGKRLVDAWLVRGDTTAALQSLSEVTRKLNLDEDDPQIIASHIKILIHQGDLPMLKKQLLNLSGAASPSHPIFNDGMELMALLDGNGEPDDPQLQTYLKAERLIRQHKLTEAIDLLLQIQGAASSIADEASVRAIQLLLTLDKSKSAVKEMDQFLLTFPDSEWRANVLVWRGEQFQFIDQKPEAAIPYYEEVIVEHPGYLGIQAVRARLRSLIGDGS